MKEIKDLFNRHLFNYEKGDGVDPPEFAVATKLVGDYVAARLYSDDEYYMAVYYDRANMPFLLELGISDADKWEASLSEVGGFPMYLLLREEKENKKATEGVPDVENSIYFNPRRTRP